MSFPNSCCNSCCPTTNTVNVPGPQGPPGWNVDAGVFTYFDGDPNGNITAERPSFAYDSHGNVWLKTSAGVNNTGWSLIIAAP